MHNGDIGITLLLFYNIIQIIYQTYFLLNKTNRTTEAQSFNSSNHQKWLSYQILKNRKERPNKSTKDVKNVPE